MRWITAATFVMLGGCQFIPGTDEHIQRQAEDAVRYQLADGDSAKFRNERVLPGSRSVCGEVNAKNAFGAYTGFTPFSFSISTKRAAILPSGDDGGNPVTLSLMGFAPECAPPGDGNVSSTPSSPTADHNQMQGDNAQAVRVQANDKKSADQMADDMDNEADALEASANRLDEKNNGH